ncbi:MAG: hypothetical protein SNJ49_15570, partial [Chloracidobacterium sp.]
WQPDVEIGLIQALATDASEHVVEAAAGSLVPVKSCAELLAPMLGLVDMGNGRLLRRKVAERMDYDRNYLRTQMAFLALLAGERISLWLEPNDEVLDKLIKRVLLYFERYNPKVHGEPFRRLLAACRPSAGEWRPKGMAPRYHGLSRFWPAITAHATNATPSDPYSVFATLGNH